LYPFVHAPTIYQYTIADKLALGPVTFGQYCYFGKPHCTWDH